MVSDAPTFRHVKKRTTSPNPQKRLGNLGTNPQKTHI